MTHPFEKLPGETSSGWYERLQETYTRTDFSFDLERMFGKPEQEATTDDQEAGA